MAEVIIVAIISFFARLIEDCRKIGLSKGKGHRLKNVHGLYDALNLHAAVSIASFALLLSHHADMQFPSCLVILVFAGVTSKGVFSQHKPERLAWADLDSRWGLIVPNGCAIAALVTGAYALSFKEVSPDWLHGNLYVESCVILAASLSAGISISMLLTYLSVRGLAENIDAKEKLRAYAVGSLDILLVKAKKSNLSESEKQQLRSNLMSYMMTATSAKTATKYFNRVKALVQAIDPVLAQETELILQERFPHRD
jgi:hypothetical protein